MDYEAENQRLAEELRSAREDLAIQQALNAGDVPEAMARLQSKVARQRAHLARLEKRVVAQRFVLRTLDRLGRSLTKEERAEALATDPKRELVDVAVLS